MADADEEKKGGSSAMHLGIGAGGGITAGMLGSTLVSKLASDPAKAYTLILDHGSSGILFFLVLLLVFAVFKLYSRQTVQDLRHQRVVTDGERAHAKQIYEMQGMLNQREKEHQAEIMGLMNRLIAQNEPLARLLAKTEVALGKLKIVTDTDDIDEQEDAGDLSPH